MEEDSTHDCPSDEVVNSSESGNNWLQSLVDTYKKYKENIFGSDNDIEQIKEERKMDYTVCPNYKFIFAKCKDGLYRPGSIIGISKKQKQFIVYFYHNKRNSYVRPKDVIVRHGNLLEKKVCFTHYGQKRKGTVFGNNSPLTRSFPTVFYIRKRRKPKWYKVNINQIVLTKKQVYEIYCNKRKTTSCDCNNK